MEGWAGRVPAPHSSANGAKAIGGTRKDPASRTRHSELSRRQSERLPFAGWEGTHPGWGAPTQAQILWGSGSGRLAGRAAGLV